MALIQLGSVEEAVGALMVSYFSFWIFMYFLTFLALAQYQIEWDESLTRIILPYPTDPATQSTIESAMNRRIANFGRKKY